MTDIVERLRNGTEIDKLQAADELMYAAANEIQRLRGALKPFAEASRRFASYPKLQEDS